MGTRDELLTMLNREGFAGFYDFVHLPVDFLTKTGFSYAVINMIDHSAALRAKQHFDGSIADFPCEAGWNRPQQGLEVHLERYRNSPLMHDSIPEHYRPLFFVNGVRENFPAPTTRIRPPRIRHQKASVAAAQTQ